MLMMCWFYCIPFAKGLFFASAPLTLLLSLFVLKRGIRRSRAGLRQLSFLMMFVALVKMCVVDIYLLRDDLLCTFNDCHDAGFFKMAQGAGLLAVVLGSLFLFNLYRSFAQDRRQKEVTPEQVHLLFWGNLSISLVMLLIFWLAAPWVGYLTVGHVPQFFMKVPWQHLAILNVIILLVGFWKLEDCTQAHDPKDKTKRGYQVSVWTVKDTLWVSVVLFALALSFSYASNDVLSASLPSRGGHLQLDINNIDLNTPLGPGFGQP